MSDLHPFDKFIIGLTQGQAVSLAEEFRNLEKNAVRRQSMRHGQVVEVSQYDFVWHFRTEDGGLPKCWGELPGIPEWYLSACCEDDYILFWQKEGRYYGRRLTTDRWHKFGRLQGRYIKATPVSVSQGDTP